MSNNLISTNTRAGDAVIVKDRKIVPFSQVLRIRAPKLPFKFTWNRPVSVLIIDEDGREEVLAVSDVTRQIQFSILGIGLIGSIIIWMTFKIIRKSRS